MREPVPLEAETQRDILLAASTVGCRLLRNNVGALKEEGGRWVFYGVGGSGGSDLIGWTWVAGCAVFTAIEVKRKGKKPTAEQESFVSAVKEAGGIAAVCYSVEDFLETVRDYRASRAIEQGVAQ